MLTPKMVAALNQQMNEEYYSAYLYLAMSAAATDANLPGAAHWFRVQYQEEIAHFMKLFDYVHAQGETVKLMAIQEPPAAFGTITAMFEQTLKHEQHITACIHKLMTLAQAEKDHATAIMLQWFVNEQVEEESNDNAILAGLRMAGEKGGALFMIDRQLGQRKAG